MQPNHEITVPQSLDSLRCEALPSDLWKLRWRFEFHGNKPARRGVWDSGSDRTSDSAWAVDKSQLAWACVEGEHRTTQEEHTLVRCAGADYAFFQWEAYTRSPSIGFSGTFNARPTISGISLYTRSERITVLINGTWTSRPLTIDELTFSFKEHSHNGVI